MHANTCAIGPITAEIRLDYAVRVQLFAISSLSVRACFWSASTSCLVS